MQIQQYAPASSQTSQGGLAGDSGGEGLIKRALREEHVPEEVYDWSPEQSEDNGENDDEDDVQDDDDFVIPDYDVIFEG